MFSAPEPVALATGEAFSSIERHSGNDRLFVAGADLKGAFYRPELPAELREYQVLACTPGSASS